MRILLTNDDGIHAPGIAALRSELQKLGDVTLISPSTEQSGVSHTIRSGVIYDAKKLLADVRAMVAAERLAENAPQATAD